MTLDGNAVEIVGVMPRGGRLPARRGVLGARRADPRQRNAAEYEEPRHARCLLRRRADAAGPAHGRAAAREVNAAEARLDRADAGPAEVGHDRRRDAVRRLRLRTGASGAPRAVGGGRRAAADRLRERFGADADARLAAAARAQHSTRARRHAPRDRRSWLAEVLLVAIAGGALGLAVAHWIARAIVALAPDDLPRVADIGVDGPVALFTFCVVVARSHTVAVPLGRRAAQTCPERSRGSGRPPGAARCAPARHCSSRRSRCRSSCWSPPASSSAAFRRCSSVDLGFRPARVLSLTVQPQGT